MRLSSTGRMLIDPSGLSFRGAAGDEESRESFVSRARFLASLGMTAFTKVFQHAAGMSYRVRYLFRLVLLPLLQAPEEALMGGQAVIEGVMMRSPAQLCRGGAPAQRRDCGGKRLPGKAF